MSLEQLALLSVAVLGATGLARLGNARSEAIGGQAKAEAPASMPVAPLSTQAGVASILGATGEVLYRGVKGKARPPREIEGLSARMRDLAERAAVGEAIPHSEIAALSGADGAATASLVHGLLNEQARLVVENQLRGVPLELVLSAVVRLADGGADRSFKSALTSRPVTAATHFADLAQVRGASGPALPFLERLRMADRIFRDGITPAELKRAFGLGKAANGTERAPAVRVAAASDALFDYVEIYPSPPAPRSVYEWQYLTNPERALSALSDAARGYLETEVLPILRATYVKKDAPMRYLTNEGEAQVMSRLVRGDVAGAKKALAAGKRTGAPALPADMAEAVTFASRLFSGGDAPFGKLRAFSEEEASTLVRFSDDVLADLRSRADGGALIADIADVLRGRDWTRAAGRTEAHQTKALESLLQAVARGSEDDYKRAHGFVTQIVSDFSKDLADELNQLLEHFHDDAGDDAAKAM